MFRCQPFRHRRRLALALAFSLALLSVACSGGGGGGGGGGGSNLSAATWNGTWDIVANEISSTCAGGSTGTLTSTADISIAADGATATIYAPQIRVDVVGNRLQGYSGWNLTEYDLTLTGANTFTGTQVSNIPGFGGNPGCARTYSLTGTRSTTAPARLDASWQGAWLVVAVPLTTDGRPARDERPSSEVLRIDLTTTEAGVFAAWQPEVHGLVDGQHLRGMRSGDGSEFDLELTAPGVFVGTQRTSVRGDDGATHEQVLLLTGSRLAD